MIFDIKKLIDLRRKLHENPEIGFHQFQTQKSIRSFLLDIGIPDNQIKSVAKTGLLLDLKGTGQNSGKNKLIAFRADIDALETQQTNFDLEYRSKNKGISHACGHDGHTAWLLGFIMKFLDQRDKIPNNIIFRIIFQPSEQGPLLGARQIIEEGHINGVDEIYGIHNIPIKTPEKVWIRQGSVLSGNILLNLRIKGTSGHSSTPELVKNALREGARFYNKFYELGDKLKSEKLEIIPELTIFKCGQRCNVFSQECNIQGTIKSFSLDTYKLFKQKIDQWISQMQSRGFSVTSDLKWLYPVTINTPKEVQNVVRVVENYLGKQAVGKGQLPIGGSEDFSLYTQIIPGAYFIISTAKEHNDPLNHSNKFNFNDESIELGAQLWWRLALDRAFIE